MEQLKRQKIKDALRQLKEAGTLLKLARTNLKGYISITQNRGLLKCQAAIFSTLKDLTLGLEVESVSKEGNNKEEQDGRINT